MRLTEDEYQSLSPRRFNALRRMWSEIERAKDRRAALITCMLANIYRNADTHPSPFEVEEFMPQFAKPASRRMTDEEMLEQVRILNAMVGGRENIEG